VTTVANIFHKSGNSLLPTLYIQLKVVTIYCQPSLLSNGLPEAFSLGVKRPGREADHSLPSTAEVKECAEL